MTVIAKPLTPQDTDLAISQAASIANSATPNTNQGAAQLAQATA